MRGSGIVGPTCLRRVRSIRPILRSLRSSSSPADDAARKDAAVVIGRRIVLWGIPIAAIAALCLALGVPWWLVTGGIVAFVVVILFEI